MNENQMADAQPDTTSAVAAAPSDEAKAPEIIEQRIDPPAPLPPPKINRRAFPRREGKGRIECRPDKFGMGKPISGPILDLSQGGAVFGLPQAFEAKLEIDVDFILPSGNRKQKLRVKVVKSVETEEGDFAVFVSFEKRLPYDIFLNLSR